MKPSTENITIGIHEYEWASPYPIRMRIDRLRESRGSLGGEVSVKIKSGKDWKIIYGFSRLSLLDNKKRKEVADGCRSQLVEYYGDDPDSFPLYLKEFPWLDSISSACNRTIELFREGEPVIKVGNNPVVSPKYAAYPLIALNSANIIYGAGGSMKSYMALMICCAFQTGGSIAGIIPNERFNCLILDYEANHEEHNYRLMQLKEGLKLPPNLEIHYRRGYQSIPNEIDRLQEIVKRENIGFIVVDSYGMSCGGESEKQSVATEYFMALRSLNITTLIIDHVAWDNTKKGPYGSVYKYNEARCVWEIKADQDEGSPVANIGVFHTKFNNGPRVKPMGLKFEFFDEGTGLFVDTTDAKDSPVLSAGMTAKDQIASILKRGGMKPFDIAELTGLKEDNVRRALNRWEHKAFTKLMDGQWGLKSKREDD